jgi:uncharacterized delta-60 repeat protein
MTIVSLAAVTVSPTVAFAAPGSLDSTFGSGGTVTLGGGNEATGVAVVPPGVSGAGDVVVSSWSGTQSSPEFQLARFNPSGAVEWQNNYFNGQALAVAVIPAGQPNAGNIVAAGFESMPGCTHGAVVAEFTPSGQEQSATPVACATTSQFNGVAIDSSGRFVGAGFATNGTTETLVGRFNNNDTVDTEFGTSGTVENSLPGATTSEASAVGVVSTGPTAGDIVTSGFGEFASGSGSSTFLTVAEFTPTTGALDTQFGASTGIAKSGLAGSQGSSVAVLPGVNIVAGGTTPAGPGHVFLLDQFTPTGSPDTSFGGGQVVNQPSLSTSEGFQGLAYNPNGNVLVAAGNAGPAGTQSAVVAEYNATTGSLNSFFGSGGSVSRSFPSAAASAFAVAVQGDGKVVAAGAAPVVGSVTQILLFRALGPTVTVGNVATLQKSSTGPISVSFPVSIDEPLFSSVLAQFCAGAGAVVTGQGQCGTFQIAAGSRNLAVPVTVNLTAGVGNQQAFTLSAESGGGLSASPSQGRGTVVVQHIPPPPAYKGYWLVAADGGIFNYGTTHFFGSTGGVHLNKPIVGMAVTPDGKGYWLVASDGGIFNYGDARFLGSTGNVRLNKPIVAMARTADGKGYWLVASDGGIFNYGDAHFFGSTGNVRLNKPIVGMAATPDGKGYWLVASDGGIFSYGDARFFGSTGNVRLNKPIVGIAAYPGAGGYWMVASDGGIFSFGAAKFHGSTGNVTLAKPVVAMDATFNGGGYYLVASDGGIFAYGNARFFGSTGGVRLVQPIVGMAG